MGPSARFGAGPPFPVLFVQLEPNAAAALLALAAYLLAVVITGVLNAHQKSREGTFKIRKAQTLPTLCMRCGAPGALIREHLFHWYSPILYFALLVFFSWPLPYFLFVLCDKRRRVAVPLCEAHQSHWATRRWTTGAFRSVAVDGNDCTLTMLSRALPAMADNCECGSAANQNPC